MTNADHMPDHKRYSRSVKASGLICTAPSDWAFMVSIGLGRHFVRSMARGLMIWTDVQVLVAVPAREQRHQSHRLWQRDLQGPVPLLHCVHAPLSGARGHPGPGLVLPLRHLVCGLYTSRAHHR